MSKPYYRAGSVTIRDAEMQDVFNLAPNVRQSDRSELWKANHRKPEQALVEGYKESIACFTVVYKGRPIAMFGIVAKTILGRIASVWFLASPEMNKMQHIFKHSRRFISLMLSYYSVLENYVDVENTQSIRWLKWCGFTLESPKPYGIESNLFRHFYIRRKG